LGVGLATPSRKNRNAAETFTTTQETPVQGEEGPASAGRMTCWGQSRKELTPWSRPLLVDC
jgi:hypothetical protein